jgi:hypothetical protein
MSDPCPTCGHRPDEISERMRERHDAEVSALIERIERQESTMTPVRRLGRLRSVGPLTD